MARLFKKDETRQFVYEWQGEGTRGQRFINDAAHEQRANLEAVKRNGQSGWCDVREYETCVRMLEHAAERIA